MARIHPPRTQDVLALLIALLLTLPACLKETATDLASGGGSLSYGTESPSTENNGVAPVTSVAASEYTVSGTAYKSDAGTIDVVLNPLVAASTGAAVQTVASSDLSATCGGQAVTVDSVSLVSPTDGVATDLVFVVDTTGSMSWAIDGVKSGITAFVDGVKTLGFSPQVGGIEYGDDIRTSRDLTDISTFSSWVSTLDATGGGDATENPLDSIEKAFDTFTWRAHAQRYFVVITDEGMHEKGDATDYPNLATTTLAQTVAKIKGRALFGVIHSSISGGSGYTGLSPSYLPATMGGFYIKLSFSSLLSTFDIAASATLDDNLKYTRIVKLNASDAAAKCGTEMVLTYTQGGVGYATTFPIQ